MTENKEKIRENSKIRKEFERRKLLRLQAKRRKRRKRLAAIIITLVFIIIILPTFLLGSFIVSLDNNKLIEGVTPTSTQSLNILILGLDTGDYENLENTNSQKTDTIMVLNYNKSTKKINIVSIPRDTLIEIEAYDGEGNLRSFWKINNACVLGGDEEILKHVESLLEIEVNYMIKVNYQAFKNFIDAIGGVEMFIEQDMFYDDDTQDLHINFKGGETVLLDGINAEKFFRWRGNNDGTGLVNGDLGRIENQQLLIKEVIKKCLKPSIIFKIPGILDVIKEDISTNMPASKIISYGIKFLYNNGISMDILQGYPETLYGESFLVVDKDSNREVIDTLKFSEILFGNSSIDNYSILVLNGTRINGLARNLKSNMEYMGYKNVEIGNIEDQDKSVIISNDKELREQLKLDIGINKFSKNKSDKYEEYDAVIIIGEDCKLE